MFNDYSDSKLTVNLSALEENYKLLADKAGDAECAAVVKANAYGLGIDKVAKALKDAGCTSFFVATLDEAIELRSILPTEIIYIFHGVSADQEDVLFKNNLIPVLNSLAQISLWENYASAIDQKLSAIIHVDTGMNRLGISIQEAQNLTIENIDLRYVMSHLSCSGEENEMNYKQLNDFKEVQNLFPGTPATLSNSSGIFLGQEYCCDMVRTGVALYGSNPTPDTTNPMKNVVTLTAKILQIRNIKEDQPVGYGATKNVIAGSRLATIPVGYADGYLRSLSNNISGFIDEFEVPLVGRVSMDLIVLDITHLPVDKARIGTEVELIGRHIPVDLIAKKAGTIGYEILTSLGSRCKREYIK